MNGWVDDDDDDDVEEEEVEENDGSAYARNHPRPVCHVHERIHSRYEQQGWWTW
nr:hypothetical protein [Tanacetum cinerariifolium]